ncbi:MAG: RluA family pseudouridine synthase [Myxococcaceae bacterium]
MSTEIRELVVAADQAGKRVDLFVKDALSLSRAVVKQLFDDGKVRVNGRIAKKGSSVESGQNVRVEVETHERTATPDTSFQLEVLHEDDDLLFVNKPAHRPSHPLKPGETGTVANAIVAMRPECGQAAEDPREGGLCHRLDVETSGVLLAAKNRAAWDAMRKAFSERGGVDKRYWALVTGPIADDGEIELPLRHHARHSDRVEPAAEGGPGAREAYSEFKVLAREGERSLVEVRIHTGVLHQVRAHLAAIGAPLVGDALYGGKEWPGLTRFFLHARSLEVTHPVSGQRVKVEAPLPDELKRVLAEARIELR